MIRTQVQLPDALYRKARSLASQREISMAELLRRGLEHMLATAGELGDGAQDWSLPEAQNLGGHDPFAAPDWRMRLHTSGQLAVAEDGATYGNEEQAL